MQEYNINSILASTAKVSIAMVVLAVVVCAIFSSRVAIVSILASAPAGFLALWVLAKDLQHAVEIRSFNKFMLKFVFRLACFSILLYLLLVRLRLHPLGCMFGLSVSVFAMGAIVFRLVYREIKTEK